ncbi:hypothetical protein EDB87DRAFT_187751 [Lactarius vividus]|nr:hypothetical protein EDB87DRAFT_187751 [Lactarius vividus]
MTSPAFLSNISTSSLLEALIFKFDNGFVLDENDTTGECTESISDEVRKLATLLPRLQMILARRQNNVAAINKLPVEILAHIFKLASMSEADAHPAQCIIVLSLVCSHWRQTALGFPALWTTIHLREGAIHDFQLATLCLERSKDASLSIVISTLFRGEQISNFFLPYSSRIESVSISIPFKCSSYDVPRFLLSTCGFRAPRLKSLRLCTAMWGSYHSPVLPPILGGDISRVTHLQVESFSPYPGHIFGCLTHLALSSQSQYEKRPSMTEFLDFLAANPYLEELLLDDAGPSLNTSDRRLPIYLPHLRLLCFVSTLTERALASRVLSHLRLPRHCCIRAHRDMDPSHPDELLPSSFPADVHLLPTFGSVEKLSIRDDMKVFGECSIRYSATSRHSGISTSYRLRSESDVYNVWPEAALNCFLRSLPCSQIRSLCLSLGKSSLSFHVEGWRSLFERLTALEELSLTDMDVSNVVEGLTTQCPDTECRDILPKLSSFRLTRPKALNVDSLVLWSEERTKREHPIDCALIILLEMRVVSSPDFNQPDTLPKNVHILIAEPTSADFGDHTFDEPSDMTWPPFGRDVS